MPGPPSACGWATSGLPRWAPLLTREQILEALERSDRALTTAADVLAIVSQFYPVERLPVRTRLLIEELFP